MTLLTSQYCVVKYVMAAVIFVLQLCGVYDEGRFQWNRGYVYVCAVSNISQFVALYCLLKVGLARLEIRPARSRPLTTRHANPTAIAMQVQYALGPPGNAFRSQSAPHNQARQPPLSQVVCARLPPWRGLSPSSSPLPSPP